LQAAFRSWRLAALLSALLPLCLAGGFVVALIDGQELTLGSLLGLLAVFGLATRTTTVLVADLQDQETRNSVKRAARMHRVTAERLTPILTSTLALAALAIPVAFLGARPGLELLHPMALVLLGGLVTTSVVTLFVLPSLYQHLVPEEPVSAEDQVDLTQRERDEGEWPRQRVTPVEMSDEKAAK
ncbi:MAG: efflux RND transporter permease subunit, partial [Actinomycetes bacterium]